MCEMLCFSMEMGVNLSEGRRYKMAGTDIFAYGRLCSPIFAYVRIGPPLGSVSVGG